MHFEVGRQVSVASVFLLCLGCVELGGSTAPSRFYVLTPLAEIRDVAGDVGLGLGPIRVPGYLDRPQIVTRRQPHRLDIAPFDRWAEPLEESVARVMATNLARLLGTERVQRHPWRDTHSVQVEVEIDVFRFDGTLGNAVALDVHWRMRSNQGPVQRAAYIREPIEGDGYAALAAAMSRALATLAHQIADAVAL